MILRLMIAMAMCSYVRVGTAFGDTWEMPYPFPQGASAITLAAPAGITNLLCVRREIAPDHKHLWRETIELTIGALHIVQEEFDNEQNYVSLDVIPEVEWQSGKRVFELIRRDGRTCMRHRPLSELPQLRAIVEARIEDVKRRHPEAEVTTEGNPGEWHSESWHGLITYELTVDVDMISKWNQQIMLVQSNRVAVAFEDVLKSGDQSWECLFDPNTRVKLRERMYVAGRLVREQKYWTETNITAASDNMPCSEVQVKNTDGGIGVQLECRTEPRRIARVLDSGPARQQGMKPGMTIVSVDGRDTSGLSCKEIIAMLRGPPNTKVSVKCDHDGAHEEYKLVRQSVTSMTGEDKKQ